MKKTNTFVLALFPVLAQLVAIVEIFAEKELSDKADDVIFLVLAILSMIVIKGGRTTSKALPIILMGLAVAIKLVAIGIEHDDVRAVNPDYLILVFMALGFVINAIYNKRKSSFK